MKVIKKRIDNLLMNHVKHVNENKVYYVPILGIIIYIIFTLMLNIFGPWSYLNYHLSNKLSITVYMTIFLITSYFFYNLGVTNDFRRIKISRLKKEYVVKIIIVSCLLTTFILVWLIVEGMQSITIKWSGGNFLEILAKIYERSKIGVDNSRSLPLTLYILLYYFIHTSFTLGFYYFSDLDGKYSILLIVNLLLFLIYNIMFVGSAKPLGDILIIILSVIAIKIFTGFIKLTKRKIIVFLLLGIFCFLLFGNLFLTRYINVGSLDYLFNRYPLINTDHVLFSFFSRDTAIALSLSIYYISHGYYGLSLTLKLPFVWTYGLGSSFFIKNTLTSIFNISNLPLTYPERMQEVFGWGAYSNWHTIFPWIASDFTFLGAIIIVALFIMINAICWKDILMNQNWSSIILFTILNQFILFIPANNQLFQTSTYTILTAIALIVWLVDHEVISINFKKNI